MKAKNRVMNVYLQAIIINKMLGDTFLEELISGEDLDDRLSLEENIETIKNRVKDRIRGIIT